MEPAGKISTLCWWEEDETKRYEAAWENVSLIERNSEYRRSNDLLHASLYGNAPKFGFSPRSYSRPNPRAHTKLALNVVRNMISAATSKIAAKNKVHPKFLTSDGDYSLQRRAEDREKIVGGILYEQKFYKKQRGVFREAGIFGTGFVRPWIDLESKKVTIDRIPQADILVDDEDAQLGNPWCLYYRKWYDKRVLAKLFPDKKDVIERAGKREIDQDVQAASSQSTVDIIPVFEAFHRRATPTSNDGLRMIFVDSGELGSEEWNYDYHPFPRFCWTEEPDGFFGTGIAYELAGIQAEINDVLQEFARAHRLIKGFWAAEMSSKIVLKHLNDDLGKIVRYAGVAPTYYQPTAIPQDTYRYLWDLYARAYEIVGISQLSATGQKPPGLNSGEAQRVYLDEQTERFLEVGTNLEDWTLEVTEQTLDRARELATKGGGFSVKAKTGRGMQRFQLKESDFDDGDEFLIQIFPTSLLPTTPAGRLAFLGDLIEMKLVSDQQEALRLLGFPDMDAYMQRENAPRDNLEKNIETILRDGKWVAPEPLDDHELALQQVPLAIAQARVRGVSAERISMLRRYVVITVRLEKLKASGQLDGAIVDGDPNANPDAGPPPGPGGPPPGGPGGPPPMPPGAPPPALQQVA